MKNNQDLGLLLLGESMQTIIQYVDYASIFKYIFSVSEDLFTRLWQTIEKYGNDFHKRVFLSFLPEEHITRAYFEAKISLYKGDFGSDIFITHDRKFQDFDNTFFQQVLPIIVERNEKENMRLGIWDDFFGECVALFKDNFDLFFKAYLQQSKLKQYYDFNQENLRKIIIFRHETLLDYIKYLYPSKDMRYSDDSYKLGFVWSIDNIEPFVNDAIEHIIEQTFYFGNGSHPIAILFENIENEYTDKAIAFLLDFIPKYHQDSDKMDAVFSVINSHLKQVFDEAFLLYLSHNQDIEQFYKIHWNNSGNGGIIRSAETNFGDIEATKWQHLLDLVPNDLKYLPIRKHLKSRIDSAKRYTESEEVRRFLDDWY